MAFEGFREKVVEVVVTVFHELTNYRFYVDSSISSSELLKEFPKIKCEYIPKGMICKKDKVSEFTAHLYYRNDNNKYFELTRRIISSDSGHETILDTEDATTYITYINGIETTVNLKRNGITFIWAQKNILYKLTSNTSLEETTKIAENIKEFNE
jgi:hypothetical protein